MKVLLAPDSYKGCLSSVEVCAAMSKGIKIANPNIEIVQFPSSDGGEGFCDCMRNIYGGEYVEREVTYPMGDGGKAVYIYNSIRKIAFIELASAAGLNLVSEANRDILKATTYGVGQLIKDAISLGAKRIIIGLGGSATNDCGIGLLSALGVRFLDEQKNVLDPIANSINKVRFVDKSKMQDISNVEFFAACDVRNPLCGENGAAKVFARQKGASDAEIEFLDMAAKHFSRVLDINPDCEGYGAAGGVGMALITVLGAKYVSGASLLITSDKFQDAIKNADLVITGEGNTDAQTANGKLVSIVASAAKEKNVPVIVLSGGLSSGYEELFSAGVAECHSLVDNENNIKYCISHARELILKKSKSIIEQYISKI